MKSFFTLLISVVVIFFCISCKKDLNGKYNNQNEKVEQFIHSLLEGTYKSASIPYFSPEDIPALLQYADDLSLIPYFPSSNICSYTIFSQFRLGECILWTIESIRTKYPYENSYSQFPSCVPILLENKFIEDASTISGIDPLNYAIDNQELNKVYKEYRRWWENCNTEGFEKIREINPLDNLNFFWY